MDIKNILIQIKPLLKSKGFRNKGRLFYLIQNDIAYCIELEQPTGLIYLAFYILPLYIPFENRCFTYGSRIAIGNSQTFEKFDNSKALLDAFSRLFDTTIFPFFQKTSSPRKLIELYENHIGDNIFVCAPVDKKRLYYHTYAFLRNAHKTSDLAKQYRFALNNATHYTAAAKDKYYREIESVYSLSKLEGCAIDSHYAQLIQQTLEKCIGL